MDPEHSEGKKIFGDLKLDLEEVLRVPKKKTEKE